MATKACASAALTDGCKAHGASPIPERIFAGREDPRAARFERRTARDRPFHRSRLHSRSVPVQDGSRVCSREISVGSPSSRRLSAPMSTKSTLYPVEDL